MNHCGKRARAHVCVDVSLASFRILGESNSGDMVFRSTKDESDVQMSLVDWPTCEPVSDA